MGSGMSGQRTIIVVGAGQAGGRAAQGLRQAGFEGRVVLIGAEPHLPYERPPLSKELLAGDGGIDKALLHDEAFYADQSIELRAGAPATAIDPAGHIVAIEGGETLAYDTLLLATGARVRELPIPGADLDGVHYLRTIEDSQAIRAGLSANARIAVIGGGFIGLEVAASARSRGCRVTVLEAAERLMGRSVAPEISDWFAELHRGHGVDLRLGARIEAIEGDGRVQGIALAGGETVPADLVIIGIGIVANTGLAEAAGLEVDNGIVVDEFGRTSNPDIYAVGDVANQPNAFLGRRVRLESYQNAQDQAIAVARNMAGEARPYEDSLWVWSDQYDVNLQMTGMADDWDELVWRGEAAGGSFTVFYLRDGRVIAVNTVNSGRDMRAAQRLMASGNRVDPAQLADPAVKLIKLARG